MDEEDFKPGDVVQLKSGGPKMTINQELNKFPDLVSCVWFPITKDTPCAAQFHSRALKRVEL